MRHDLVNSYSWRHLVRADLPRQRQLLVVLVGAHDVEVDSRRLLVINAGRFALLAEEDLGIVNLIQWVMTVGMVPRTWRAKRL